MKRMILGFALVFTVVAPATAIDPKLVERVQQIERFASDKGPGTEAERVHRLYELAWNFYVESSPELATYLGIPGSNDRWSDGSFEAEAFGEDAMAKVLAAAKAIDRAALPAEEVGS